jgi:rhodanese-related sulfurtransferase
MVVQLEPEVVVKDLLPKTMIKSTIHILILFIGLIGFSQESLSEVLKKYNTENIPYISVNKLNESYSNTIILDARENSEFNVSHLQNAIHVGYDDFKISQIKNLIKNTESKIVVYCSIGVRSEDIAIKLQEAGYTNVYNLFGGIFEWKNNNFTVYDNDNKPTEKVHAYSKTWGKWLLKGIKVYD